MTIGRVSSLDVERRTNAGRLDMKRAFLFVGFLPGEWLHGRTAEMRVYWRMLYLWIRGCFALDVRCGANSCSVSFEGWECDVTI